MTCIECGGAVYWATGESKEYLLLSETMHYLLGIRQEEFTPTAKDNIASAIANLAVDIPQDITPLRENIEREIFSITGDITHIFLTVDPGELKTLYKGGQYIFLGGYQFPLYLYTSRETDLLMEKYQAIPFYIPKDLENLDQA